MKLPHSLLLATASALCLLSPAARAETRPHYGGTLRVQVRESLTTLNDIATRPTTLLRQQLSLMLFDRLVRLDSGGSPQPALAVSWHADSQQRVWQFELRPGVRFNDGSPLSAASVVAALGKADRGWKVTAPSPHSVTIETESASPHLPEIVSLPEYSITRTVTDDSGADMAIGSGAFKLTAFQPGARVALAANDDYWAGRPYLNAIEITMNGSLREQLISRRLDYDDAVELSLDQARLLGYSPQTGSGSTQRLIGSSPSDLYALVFAGADTAATARSPIDDPRIREAIALTLDRNAISRVVLQKQAETAFALLPQWLTGYGFLFSSAPDPERARNLRNEAVRNAVVSIPLAYDAADSAARAIAERVAVNAREVNIVLQVYGEKNLDPASSGPRLMVVRLPLASANAQACLADLAVRVSASESASALVRGARDDEALYAAERALLQDFRIVPLVHLPQVYWLNSRVHNWPARAEGGWHFEDVWVESVPSAVQR